MFIMVLVGFSSLCFTGVARADVRQVMSQLGPIVFNGVLPDNNHLVILWNEETATVWLNGSIVTGRTMFSLNSSGDLVVSTSNLRGYNGIRVVLSSGGGGMLNMATCTCFGGAAVKSRCTTAQCDEAGTSCSVPVLPAGAYCRWGAIAPLAVSR